MSHAQGYHDRPGQRPAQAAQGRHQASPAHYAVAHRATRPGAIPSNPAAPRAFWPIRLRPGRAPRVGWQAGPPGPAGQATARSAGPGQAERRATPGGPELDRSTGA
jgi:hypothetical protein